MTDLFAVRQDRVACYRPSHGSAFLARGDPNPYSGIALFPEALD